MRFKAKLAPEQLGLFYNLIVPMSKICPSDASTSSTGLHGFWTRSGSVLCLEDDFLRLSTKGKSSDSDNVRCFAELKTKDGIFLEHRIESQAEHNRILMEVDLVQLRTALQSLTSKLTVYNNKSTADNTALHQQEFTILKLAKRNNIPCLCLECPYTTSSVQVHHSIPVRMLKATDLQQYLPPPMQQQPQAQIELPSDKPLRPVLEGLRHMSPTVHIEVKQGGELTLICDSDGASVRTFFGALQQQAAAPSDCTVKVDTKKLCLVLSWQQLMASTAILVLVENEMLVLHVNLHPSSVGFFTYYVPVHYISKDPADE
jgi:HUS1 checkpoint protein